MTERRSEEERPRLFVAIGLPERWREALSGSQERLRRRLEADGRDLHVRFVRPEGVHLTLKFLGETAADRLPAIESALSEAVPEAPNIHLELSELGSFNDGRAPRVVWAGVAGDTRALSLLVDRIETRLTAAGFPRERRRFRPHLTLARLPETLTAAQREYVAQASSEDSLAGTGPFLVEQVSLMRSWLRPGGARYECLARFPPSRQGRERLQATDGAI